VAGVPAVAAAVAVTLVITTTSRMAADPRGAKVVTTRDLLLTAVSS